jgi:peptidoglycan-associated lipoprotein
MRLFRGGWLGVRVFDPQTSIFIWRGSEMRASIARFATLLVVVIAMGAFGCKSTPKETTTTDTQSEWKESPGSRDTGMDSKKLDMTAIYFDYDRSDIRADQRDTLKTNAEKINGMTGNVTVEGHCDERGSEEYNLALGERRADTVKRYLVDLGVQSGRLSTVSFGESRPAVQGHDESAWRYNRRADFVGQ